MRVRKIFNSNKGKYLAAMRELASLGKSKSETARLLKTSSAWITQASQRYGIQFLGHWSRDTPLQRAICDGYARGVSPAIIASENGASVKSISVLANRMGVQSIDPFSKRRGYVLPPNLSDEYADMRRLGLTAKEAGYCLGLLPRPAAKQEIHA